LTALYTWAITAELLRNVFMAQRNKLSEERRTCVPAK
jgi:hypothetical protein